MEQVKAINSAKSKLRDLIAKINCDIVENAGQRDGMPQIRFGPCGRGSESAYHSTALPYLDLRSPTGVRIVTTDMHKGAITNVSTLSEMRDEVKGKLDLLSEMGEMESLRLQMAMDRLSKLMSTLSNLLKKASDTDTAMISNLK